MTRDEAKEVLLTVRPSTAYLTDAQTRDYHEAVDLAIEVLNGKPVMDKDDAFRIGMDLHKITMSLTYSQLEIMNPWIKEIENIVYKYTEAGQKEANNETD